MSELTPATPVAWAMQSTLDRLARLTESDGHGANNCQLANKRFEGIGCVVPLYASPVTPIGTPETGEGVVRVKALEWERITEQGMEGTVRFWRAVNPTGGHLWINVETDDFDAACSLGAKRFSNSAAAMNYMDDLHAARIKSALEPTPSTEGADHIADAGKMVPDGWAMVPRVRSEAMHMAAQSTTSAVLTHGHSEEIWNAMLAAAPKPSTEGVTEADNLFAEYEGVTAKELAATVARYGKALAAIRTIVVVDGNVASVSGGDLHAIDRHLRAALEPQEPR